MQPLYDLRDNMPRHWSPGASHHRVIRRFIPSAQPLPREAEDFPRADIHFKQVPPPTYLICLSPKDLYTVGSI